MMEKETKFKKTEIGMIPEDWRIEELRNTVTKLGDGLHGTPKYDTGGDYFFINGNNLVNSRIKMTDNTKKCSKEEFDKYKKELTDRTILVSINGTLGNVAFYNNEKVILGKSACYFNLKNNIDKNYVKYILLGNLFQNYIQLNATGTVIKNMPLKRMREFKFPLPTLSEQKAIAKILSDLDSKIETLQKQNEVLENMGQLLFKRWFADFEFPDEDGKGYRSNGGEMVESELGEIPTGWRVGKLGEIGKIICGKTPSTKNKDYFEGTIPFIKIPDMHNNIFILKTGETLSEEGKNSQTNKTIPQDSICVSCIATVGVVSMTTKDSQTNQQINSIIPSSDFIKYYLYYYLKSIKNKLKDIGSGGAVTLNVNTSVFSNISILVPSEKILKRFNDNMKASFTKIKNNMIQIQSLTKLRDTLLPKLMSGKVRVSL